MEMFGGAKDRNVLVGVLKSKSDQHILLTKHWYRIPAEHFPKKKFEYVAFYQPAALGRVGKRIEYYGKVSGIKVLKRIELLPKESRHPRAKYKYFKIIFKKIIKLQRSVKNTVPRRIYFGFTSLKALLNSRNILELYGIPPTEQIIEKELIRNGIKPVREVCVSKNRRKYRIDLAIYCGKKRVAIECDNKKAHAGKVQARKDRLKDSFLRRNGWQVVRLKEREILERLDDCVNTIKKVIGCRGLSKLPAF